MKEQTSKRTRKRHSVAFKAKVVVAALREDKTLNQLVAEFGVQPVVICGWKKQALESIPGVLGQRAQANTQAVEAREMELYKQIGRLAV